MEQTKLIPSFFDALLLLWRMPSREQPETSASPSFHADSKDRVGEMLTRTFKLVVCKTFTRLYCLEQSESHPIESSFFWQVVGSIIDTSVKDIDTMIGVCACELCVRIYVCLCRSSGVRLLRLNRRGQVLRNGVKQLPIASSNMSQLHDSLSQNQCLLATQKVSPKRSWGLAQACCSHWFWRLCTISFLCARRCPRGALARRL